MILSLSNPLTCSDWAVNSGYEGGNDSWVQFLWTIHASLKNTYLKDQMMMKITGTAKLTARSSPGLSSLVWRGNASAEQVDSNSANYKQLHFFSIFLFSEELALSTLMLNLTIKSALQMELNFRPHLSHPTAYIKFCFYYYSISSIDSNTHQKKICKEITLPLRLLKKKHEVLLPSIINELAKK